MAVLIFWYKWHIEGLVLKKGINNYSSCPSNAPKPSFFFKKINENILDEFQELLYPS